MTSLLQTGFGMISARAGRGRPGGDEKRFLINRLLSLFKLPLFLRLSLALFIPCQTYAATQALLSASQSATHVEPVRMDAIRRCAQDNLFVEGLPLCIALMREPTRPVADVSEALRLGLDMGRACHADDLTSALVAAADQAHPRVWQPQLEIWRHERIVGGTNLFARTKVLAEQIASLTPPRQRGELAWELACGLAQWEAASTATPPATSRATAEWQLWGEIPLLRGNIQDLLSPPHSAQQAASPVALWGWLAAKTANDLPEQQAQIALLTADMLRVLGPSNVDALAHAAATTPTNELPQWSASRERYLALATNHIRQAEAAVWRLAGMHMVRQNYAQAYEFLHAPRSQIPFTNEAGRLTTLGLLANPAGMFDRVAHVAPGEKTAFCFTYRNVQKASLSVTRLDFDRLAPQLAAWTGPSCRSWAELFLQLNLTNMGQVVEQRLLSLNTTPFLDHQTNLDLTCLQPGVYWVAVHQGASLLGQTMLIAETITTMNLGWFGGSYRVVADTRTDEPVTNTRCRFLRQVMSDETNVFVAVQNDRTGPEGTVAPNFSGTDMLLLADRDGALTRAIPLGDHPFHSSPRAFRVAHLATDRPAYRPGDTLHWNMTVGCGMEGKQSRRIVWDAANLVAFGPRHERVELPAGTNAPGAVSGSYALPATMGLGIWRLRPSDERIRGDALIRIEEYRKPEFEVLVQGADKPLRPGTTYTIRIAGKGFDGMPLGGASGSCVVATGLNTEKWLLPQPWDWLYGAGHADYWRTGFQNSLPGADVTTNITQTVTLNGKGEAIVELQAPLQGGARHTATITLTDVSARTEQVTATVAEVQQGSCAALAVHVLNGFVEEPAACRIDIAARDPQIGTVVVTATPVPASTPGTTDGASPSPAANGFTREMRMDQQGRAALELPLPPGLYDVRAWPKDQPLAVDATRALVVGAREPSGALPPLTLATEHRLYQVGEEIHGVILSRKRSGTAYLCAPGSKDGRRLPWRTVTISNHVGRFTMQAADGDTPEFGLASFMMQHGQLVQAFGKILVPPEDALLTVVLQTDKAKYQPREKATLTIRVRNGRQQPVRANLTVAVYDAAVDKFAPPDRRSLATAIYGERLNWEASAQPGDSSLILRPDSLRQWPTVRLDEWFRYPPSLRALLPPDPPDRLYESLRSMGPRYGRGLYGRSVGRELRTALRSIFQDTALWQAALSTDSNGVSRVTIPLPDNLTRWQIRAWAVSPTLQVGETSQTFTSGRDLTLRLQVPRYLVEGDDVVLRGVARKIQEGTQSGRISMHATILAATNTAKGKGSPVAAPTSAARDVAGPMTDSQALLASLPMHVPADAQTITVRGAAALPDGTQDAMQTVIPVVPHRWLKTNLTPAQMGPMQRRVALALTAPPNLADYRVRITDSCLPDLLRALPGCLTYPYGCAEQTLNRFLPLVILDRLSRQLKLPIGDCLAAGGIELRDRNNCRLLPENFTNMVQQGVSLLEAAQAADGGWGWFDTRHRDEYITCLATRGLHRLDPDKPAVQKGLAYLDRVRREHVAGLQTPILPPQPFASGMVVTNRPPRFPAPTDQQVMTEWVLSACGQPDETFQSILLARKDKLTLTGRVLLALAMTSHPQAGRSELQGLRAQLRQFENRTEAGHVWLKFPNPSGDTEAIELQAFYLMLLASDEADGRVGDGLVQYLLAQRRNGEWWGTTKTSALCIEAIAMWITKTMKPARSDCQVDISIDGRLVRSLRLPKDLYDAMRGIDLRDTAMAQPGVHKLEVKLRSGMPKLNVTVLSKHWQGLKGGRITATDNPVKITRRHYLIDADGTVATNPLEEGALVPANAQVEVRLDVRFPTDLRYVAVEDRKPAGFECVNETSGYQRELDGYMECHERLVGFFFDKVAAGEREIRYRLRAEHPGRFCALPASASEVYQPDNTGNSAEEYLEIGGPTP
jgi:hypothetical protein